MTSRSPRPWSERQRLDVVVTSVVEKRLGALPVRAPRGRPVFVQHNRRVAAELTLRIGHVTGPPTVQITRGVQLLLLHLLDTDITRTRWSQT